jgi:hypothetical protein
MDGWKLMMIVWMSSPFLGYLRNILLLNKSRNQLPKPKMGISSPKKISP